MSVFIDASKPVGDPDHIKVFANAEAAANWLRKTTLKARHLSIGFWNERDPLRAGYRQNRNFAKITAGVTPSLISRSRDMIES